MGKDRVFEFDHAFADDTSQEEIFDKCVAELVDGCFGGYNCTVFAYGQTGTGKTYTMGTTGDWGDVEEIDVGVIPRAVGRVFDMVDKLTSVEVQNISSLFCFCFSCCSLLIACLGALCHVIVVSIVRGSLGGNAGGV
jgi:hypothetical protein